MEKWDIRHQKAIQNGLNPALAQLGRAVIRDAREHGQYRKEQSGAGPLLGAHRHHANDVSPGLPKAISGASRLSC